MKTMSKILFLSLMVTSCATYHENGVSSWNDGFDSAELLETKEYNRYSIIEEEVAPQMEVRTASVEVTPVGQKGQSLSPVEVETSTIIADARPTYSTLDLNEINLTSAATRPAVTAPAPVLEAPQAKIIVDGGRCFANLKYPAKFVTSSLRDRTAPQRYEYSELPAEYKTVQKLVKTPNGEYIYKNVRELVKPAQKVKRLIPAEYAVRQAGGAVYEDETTKLSRIICKENLSRDLVSKVQKALTDAGYGTGTASGYLNSRTLEALERYQSQSGLGAGALTLETLSALGVYSYNL